MIRNSLLTLLAGVTLTAGAATVDFTYNPNPDSPDYTAYGFSKRETYDVAIYINDATMVGSRITALSVSVPAEAEWLENATAWLSSELILENKVNRPDIASVSATVSDRCLTATFTEPYEVPAEGIYVGYSLTVTELEDYSTYPIACVTGEAEGGFYLHTSRTRLKWTDEHAESGLVSAMVITLLTDSGETDLAIGMPVQEQSVVVDKVEPITLSLTNYGAVNLTDFDYTWTAGSYSGTGKCQLETPLAPGERTTTDIEVGPCGSIGNLPLTVTATHFNGSENGDSRRTAQGTLIVMPFRPVTRPLIEEYTGLQCGYCPRGYVAMEEMSEEYQDRFVGLAYHSEGYERGCMVVMPYEDFPVTVSGYPYGTISRTEGMDPSELPDYWEKYAAMTAPADIDVSLTWIDEDCTVLQATATLDFAREYNDADMRMAIGLIADGLQNPAWRQSNYYSGEEGLEGPLWDIFTKGSSLVGGLTFNDVVVYFPQTDGIEGSVPAEITFDSHPSVSLEVALKDIVNVLGQEFINPEATLRAVGILLDGKTGAALNSNKSQPLAQTSAVKTIADSREVVSTEWYDVHGYRLVQPAAGSLAIRVLRFSDGTVQHSKVIVTED